MKLPATLLFILVHVCVYAQENKPSFVYNGNVHWDRGYCNFTSFGYLIGSGEDEKTFIPSLQMEHNYHFNKNFALGLYTGVDWLDVAVTPIGPNLKILFPNRSNKISFFIGGAVGSSVPLQDKKMEQFEVTDTRGGRFANVEIGLTLPRQSKVGFFVAGGYRHQQISYTRRDGWVNRIDKTITYNRLVIKIGIRI